MGFESNLTKGPWRLTYGDNWIVGTDPAVGEIVIAKIEAGTQSDAKLLGSSLEMLAALQGAEKALVKALPHLPADKEAVFCGEWLSEIRETIAKATAKQGASL